MHSFEAPSYITYHHNGDFSGSVVVTPPDTLSFGLITEGGGIEIPFEDIRALYLESLRRRKITQLEQADFDELEKRFMP